MDWYLQRESDLFVLNDQESFEGPSAGDRSPILSDWCQWGFIRPEKLKSPNIHAGRSTNTSDEFAYDRQINYAQVSKRPLVHDGEESNSSLWHQPPVYGQPDSQMQNSVDWMDDVFLNSLLEEDKGSMQNSTQTLNMPDSISRSQSFENFMSTMLTDPHGQMKDPTRREASESWGRMEDSSSSFFMPQETKRSAGSATDTDFTVLVPTEPSASNHSEAVASVDEPKCFEATVLQELEDITIHLDGNMRICFRDALYRLAKNTKDQHAINQNRPSFMEVNSESPSLGRSQQGESKTNVVDRTIANLMFNKPYFRAPEFPCRIGSFQCSSEDLASPESYYSSELPLQPQYYLGPT